MRFARWILPALASAIAGCGGGTQAPTLATAASVNAASTAPRTPPAGGFSQMVVFGDSLSDDGAYTPAAEAVHLGSTLITDIRNWSFTVELPYAKGGQFTVNPGPVWPALVASRLGLGLSPNLMGYAGHYTNPGSHLTKTPVYCPFADCTDFAQGGAMVSNPNGVDHDKGALTVPVSTQVQNYLVQFSSFNAGQLVTVLAGDNDVATALVNAGDQIAAGADQTAAVEQAQAAVGAAADQLAGLVQTILRDGGRYVLVITLPDASRSPKGQSLSGGTRCDQNDPSTPCFLLSNLVQLFNQRLLDDLQGSAVVVFDLCATMNDEIEHPAEFGFTNVTTPWCDMTGIGAIGSLVCNQGTPNSAAGATKANLSTWAFADRSHPTPAGHAVIAGGAMSQMRAAGWIP